LRKIPTLRAQKHFEIAVVRPQPTLVDFDAALRNVRVGCPLIIEAKATDANNASNYRPAHNTDYLQIFDWKFYRQRHTGETSSAAPSGGAAHGGGGVGVGGEWEQLPLHFPGVEVRAPVANELRGRTGQMRWVVRRGQEGRRYRVCVTVRVARGVRATSILLCCMTT